MSGKARRSWLVVPVSKPDLIARAAKSGADVIVLDLAEFVVEADRESARINFAAALQSARSAGAEVFAQVDPTALYDDLNACVHPVLAGIVITRAESVGEIAEADALLARFAPAWSEARSPGSRRPLAATATSR